MLFAASCGGGADWLFSHQIFHARPHKIN
jgi:hypothetical protein